MKHDTILDCSSAAPHHHLMIMMMVVTGIQIEHNFPFLSIQSSGASVTDVDGMTNTFAISPYPPNSFWIAL